VHAQHCFQEKFVRLCVGLTGADKREK